MRCGLLLIVLHSFINPLSAQPSDTVQVNAICIRAYQIHEDSADVALHLCKAMLSKSVQSNYLKGEGDACVILGAIYRNAGSFVISYEYFSRALKIRRTIGDSIRVAAVITNLAANMQAQCRYDSAIALVLYAINLVENAPAKDNVALGGNYLLLSNIYDEYLEPEAALKYAKLSLWSFIKTNKNELIGKAAYGLGNRFYEIGQLDSSEYYYDQAYNNFISSTHSLDYIGNILTNKAIIYRDRQDFTRADILFGQALSVLDKMGEESDYFHWYVNRADLYGAENNWVKSLDCLKKAQSSNGEISYLDQEFLYKNLAQTYAALHMMDSAYYYQKAAYVASDSLINENKRKEFTRFQTERYKKESLLEQSNAQKASSRARFFSQTAILLGVILGILAYAYFQRRRSYKLISQQKETLHKQAVDELIQNSELKYLSAGLEGREIEKENIGREMHDRLGSAMIALSWQYDAVLENIRPDSQEYLHMQKLNESLRNLYQDIRHIAHQLGSGVLERVGLVPVLEELCNDIQSTNKIDVDFSVYGMDERLSFSKEVNILRIIQELISNVLKYAKATQLSVQINQINGNISIIVEDNGIGFDPAAAFSKGVGLANVEKRVRVLNGSLQIEDRPERGVTIIVELPNINADTNYEQND